MSEELKAFHQSQIAEAAKAANNPFGFEVIVDKSVTGNAFGQTSNNVAQIVQVYPDGTMNALDRLMGKDYHPMRVKELLRHVDEFRAVGPFEKPQFFYDGRSRVFAFLPVKKGGEWKLNGSVFKNSMIIATSFDGTMPFTIGSKTYFHRCQNMFTGIQGAVKIRNSKHAMANHIANYKAEVGGYLESLERFEENVQKWMNTEMDTARMNEATKALFDIKGKAIDLSMDNEKLKEDFGIPTRRLTLIDQFGNSLERETKELGNNAWAFLNGVTHWTTHFRGGLKTHGLAPKAYKVNRKAAEIVTALN